MTPADRITAAIARLDAAIDASRRLRFKMAFQERLRAKVDAKRNRPKQPPGYFEPRYDEVFQRGTEWLNTL